MNEIGQIIQNKRIENALDIEDVVEALKVSKRYVQALENGEIELFSSKTYYYGYLKQYLRLLKLEDLDVNPSSSTDEKLAITVPSLVNFKPSLLLVITSVILSVIIYNICTSVVNSDAVDPIALDLRNNTSKFAKIE